MKHPIKKIAFSCFEKLLIWKTLLIENEGTTFVPVLQSNFPTGAS